MTPAVSCDVLLAALSVMPIQEWLRSLRPSSGIKGSDSEDLWSLLPSLPLSSFSLSSLSLSPSSLLGLGALASLTAYWLVTRPQPMRPPCNLQAQSVAVEVSGYSELVRSYVVVCVFSTPAPRGRADCRATPAAGARLCSPATRCWSFTTMTPGPSTTCSRGA